MADIYMDQGSSAPVLRRTLVDRDGPVNLTGATVTFCMTRHGANVINDGACSVVAPATDGVVQYPFSTTDTAAAGTFQGQFKVVWGGGTIQFFPSDRYLSIDVLPTPDA